MYRSNTTILRLARRYKSNSRDTIPKNRILRERETKKKDDRVSASEAIKLLRALQKSQNEPITKVIIQNSNPNHKINISH